MRKILGFALVAVLAACGQVDSDTYKPVGSTYNRSDGWFEDSSHNTVLIVDGSSTGTYFDSSGGLVSDVAMTLDNGEFVDNDTDDLVCLNGAGGTSDEDICFDVDGTNIIDVSSNTGVTDVDFNALDVISDVFEFDTTGEFLDSAAGVVCVNSAGGTNNEDVCFDLETTANEMSVTSNTGVTDYDFNAIDVISDTFEFTTTAEFIDSAAGKICVNGAGGTNNEDLCFDVETTANEILLTTNTGATRIDAGSIGLKTSTPLFMVQSAYFCGQGANGTTATYIGHVEHTVGADSSTYDFGEAGCDGLDNTTETTADTPMSFGSPFKVMGMNCYHAAGGTDDVYTFQARSAAADITGLTCNVTLDGTDNSCSVILDAPVTIAAGATMAVKQVAATNDDMSAIDTECQIFYTF